jgi:hypothetical protein
MEFWVIWREHRDDWDAFTLGIVRFADRPSLKKYVVELVSVAFITLGVGGEFGIGIRIASINGLLRGKSAELRSKNAELRSKSDQLLALVTQQAGDAKKLASENEKEARQLGKDAEAERLARVTIEASVGWRRLNEKQRGLMRSRLSNFPNVVVQITYPATAPDGNPFATDIFSSLPSSWSALGPPAGLISLSPPGLALPTGVEVFSPSGDNNLKAANALAEQLTEFGFDVSPVKQDNQHKWITIDVGFRPEGPQGEAKLRIEAAKKKKAHSNPKTH